MKGNRGGGGRWASAGGSALGACAPRSLPTESPAGIPRGPGVSMSVTPRDTVLLRLNFWLHQMPKRSQRNVDNGQFRENQFFKEETKETSSFP